MARTVASAVTRAVTRAVARVAASAVAKAVAGAVTKAVTSAMACAVDSFAVGLADTIEESSAPLVAIVEGSVIVNEAMELAARQND